MFTLALENVFYHIRQKSRTTKKIFLSKTVKIRPLTL